MHFAVLLLLLSLFLVLFLISRRKQMIFNIKPNGVARYWQKPVSLIMLNEEHQFLITRLVRNCNLRNRTISYRTSGFINGRTIYALRMITRRAVLSWGLRYASRPSIECFAHISSKGMWHWWCILRNVTITKVRYNHGARTWKKKFYSDILHLAAASSVNYCMTIKTLVTN